MRRSAAMLFGLIVVGQSPARAELRVQVSARSVGLYHSIRISVADPNPDADPAAPLEATLTMADPGDRRISARLYPVGGHRWEGRFTPERTGNYTGTVVLARGEAREIGLVPLIRVHPSSSRGFVRRIAPRSRMFECDRGGLFPMGVDIDRPLEFTGDWREEFRWLRGRGANYVRMTLPWSEDPLATDPARLAQVDRWLQAAEETGLFVQLCLDGPREWAGSRTRDIGAWLIEYERLLRSAAARWSAFASLAAWEIDLPVAAAPGEQRQCVAALRQADPHHHPVCTLEPTLDRGRFRTARVAQVDFAVRECGVGDRPADTYESPVLWAARLNSMLAPTPQPPGLSGLFAVGIGIPLVPHAPQTRSSERATHLTPSLAGYLNSDLDLRAVGAVARQIPWHAGPGARVIGDGTEPTAVVWRSYGRSLLGTLPASKPLGTLALAGENPLMPQTWRLTVQGLAPRSTLRVLDETGRTLEQREITASDGTVSFEVRRGVGGPVYVCLTPAPSATNRRAASRRR